MFFNTRYIPVRRTQVPTYVSVEHWFALWTCDGCGGPILGLGFRTKNATAPLYTSFSFCLSGIFNWIDCCGFVLGAHLLPAVLPIMVCLSSLPRYLLHVYYFSNSCFPFDDREVVFFRFPCVLVRYHSPLLGTLCMCSLYASIFLRHRSRFTFSPNMFSPWVSHCISFRCMLQSLRLCRFVVVDRAEFCVQCWWGDGVCTWFGWVMQAPKKEKAAPASKPAKSSGGGGKQKKKVCVVAGPSLEAMHFLSWFWNVLEWRD